MLFAAIACLGWSTARVATLPAAAVYSRVPRMALVPRADPISDIRRPTQACPITPGDSPQRLLPAVDVSPAVSDVQDKLTQSEWGFTPAAAVLSLSLAQSAGFYRHIIERLERSKADLREEEGPWSVATTALTRSAGLYRRIIERLESNKSDLQEEEGPWLVATTAATVAMRYLFMA